MSPMTSLRAFFHGLAWVAVLLGSLSATARAQGAAPTTEDWFAPRGQRADLDAARSLASRAELEEAIELLQLSLATFPADDAALAARLGREEQRLLELVELRESFLTELAAAGDKLRVEIDGKRRSLRVTGYADGLIQFALNKYELEELDVSAISLDDLSFNWKNAKAGKSEARAYALCLVGDRSWGSQWPRDEEGHEQILADLADMPTTLVHGSLVLDLRALEIYMGRALGRSEGRAVVALHERIFGGRDPQLEDDDGSRRRLMRALVRDALVAAWGMEELATGLHASSYEILGDELRLVYDFARPEELIDWPSDERHISDLGTLGVLKTPKESWSFGVQDGFLDVLGLQNLRHVVPFRGPLHVRYGVQVANLKGDGGMWMCGTYLHDDLERSYLRVFGLGYWVQGYERGRPSEVKRDQLYYEVAKTYFVDLVYDKTGVLTATREDQVEKSPLTLKTRKVDHGHVSIGVNTDYLTRYDSFEIQGQPDLRAMDRFRDEWVLDRLGTMGY